MSKTLTTEQIVAIATKAAVEAVAAAMDLSAPAKAVTAPKRSTRKAPAKKVTQPKAEKALPKGVRSVRASGGTLSRKDFNRTVTTYAKTRTGKGSGAYALIVANWDEVQTLRASGSTPTEVLEYFGFEV